jgi:hypothetical protein
MTMEIDLGNGNWAIVVALVRDLQGYKVAVWQDRTTGAMGTTFANDARMRVNNIIFNLDGTITED